MYTQYFGLRENPFALPPDPRYLYLSLRHQEALAHLMYGITEGGGFVQLTGEVGTGKTMMIRALLERLPETVDVALVLYPFLSVREFVAAICDDLRVAYPKRNSGLKVLIDALNAYLLKSHAKGRRTVLIIDEAQKLSHEVLEQVRLLTNLETNKDKLLQILLVGQPELCNLLGQRDLRQLAQRVTARYNLKSLLSRETGEYINHRCRVAGAKSSMFSKAALHWVHRLSGGVPRMINVICDRALLGAYAQGKTVCNAMVVRRAAAEIGRVVPKNYLLRPQVAIPSIFTIAIILLMGWELLPGFTAKVLQDDEQLAVSRRSTHNLDTQSVRSRALPEDAMATTEVAAGNARKSKVQIPSRVPKKYDTFKDLLKDPGVPTDTESAFTGLFARWHRDYAAYYGNTGCERAQESGLRCVLLSGTWNNLRQFNRPAVIEVIDGSARKHHLLVTSLSGDRVSLEIAGQKYDFPMAEIDRYWFGRFLFIWMPRGQGETALRFGMRDSSIKWVRDVLAQYNDQPTPEQPSEVFDSDLVRQIKEFQHKHKLREDGIVGRFTLMKLNAYDKKLSPPLLLGKATIGIR